MDKAKKLIDDAIANAKEKSGHNPNACTLKVPHELIGMLIGRGGETIKDSACFRVLNRWHLCDLVAIIFLRIFNDATHCHTNLTFVSFLLRTRIILMYCFSNRYISQQRND